MLNFIDECLILLWRAFKAATVIFALLFLKILNFFFALGDFFFKRGRKFQLKIKKSDFNFIYIRKLFYNFSEKMHSDRRFRRWIFSLFFISIILYFYPPSHWGPWYFYQQGTASFYSKGFIYHHAADGSLFKPYKYTAAHKSLPFGTTVKVVNIENGKSIYLSITDRGPFIKNRIIDLSDAAAYAIGIKKNGFTKVKIFTRRKFIK